MAIAYTGEIRLFAGNYAPLQWAFCDGQLLTVSGYEQLFSLIGNNYGGNGRTNFALPDFRGRIPVHQGIGTGLTPRSIGQMFGEEEVKLDIAQIPNHTHSIRGSTHNAITTELENKVVAQTVPSSAVEENTFYDDSSTQNYAPFNDNVIGSVGGGNPHPNLQPFLCLNFIICINGVYPTRN